MSNVQILELLEGVVASKQECPDHFFNGIHHLGAYTIFCNFVPRLTCQHIRTHGIELLTFGKILHTNFV